MTTPYTPEERERAAGQFSDAVRLRWAETGDAIDSFPSVGIDLQMRLNRLERREAEARELLSLARAASQTIAHKAEWARRNGAWLSEEGV